MSRKAKSKRAAKRLGGKEMRMHPHNTRQRDDRAPSMDPDIAFAIVDDDLSDGAYFAMMEEMTGLEIADLVDWDD